MFCERPPRAEQQNRSEYAFAAQKVPCRIVARRTAHNYWEKNTLPLTSSAVSHALDTDGGLFPLDLLTAQVTIG